MKTRYCAVSRNGRYVVCTLSLYGDFTPVGDCRSFDNFDEANTVAEAFSNGEYNYKPGEFVNMR